MKRARMLLVLSLLCSLGVISQCYGAPSVQLDALDRATGITGLDIGGTEYDALFHVGPASEVWLEGIKAATFWGRPSDAEEAVKAMIKALNDWPSKPSELAVPDPAVSTYFMVPHSNATGGFFDLTVAYGVFDGDAWRNNDSSPAASTSDIFPWVTFTEIPEVGTIPAPSALVLTMTGMMSLLGVGRLRRRHWGPQQDLI